MAQSEMRRTTPSEEWRRNVVAGLAQDCGRDDVARETTETTNDAKSDARFGEECLLGVYALCLLCFLAFGACRMGEGGEKSSRTCSPTVVWSRRSTPSDHSQEATATSVTLG